MLSEGLFAVTENVEHLIVEAEILAGFDKYARADFIVATADEEMAKSFILLDMCRLDFESHEGPLRRLCRAFYSHVDKYAYNEVIRFNCRNLEQVKDLFHYHLKTWWPSPGIESGEPDMPHHTYFTREANLYVDYIEYDAEWFVPSPRKRNRLERDMYEHNLKKSKEFFERILFSRDNGFFKIEILDMLNNIFRSHYIKEDTPNDHLFRLHERVSEKIETNHGIRIDAFKKSIICEWPLYHFLQTAP